MKKAALASLKIIKLHEDNSNEGDIKFFQWWEEGEAPVHRFLSSTQNCPRNFQTFPPGPRTFFLLRATSPGFTSQAINEDSKAVQGWEVQQPHTDVVTDTTGGFGGGRKVPEEILTRKIPFPPHREFLKLHRIPGLEGAESSHS